MRRSRQKKVLAARKPTPGKRRHIDSVAGRINSIWHDIDVKKGKGHWCFIRRLGGIGDVVMILPTLEAIKKKYPHAKITFAIDMHSTANNVYYELCKNLPYINHLIDARYVKRDLYDKCIDISAVCIRHERKDLPAINRIDLFANACGVPLGTVRQPHIMLEKEEIAWARKQVEDYRTKRLVVLHTASMEEKRCWPIQKYVEIVEQGAKIRPDLHFLVIDYNSRYPHWDKHANVSDFSQTTLREMMAIIDIADLFIGPDSGPMHLAGALGTESIVIFGSIPPEARINHYPTHTAVTLAGLKCLGCWYEACPLNVKCMKELPSDVVWNVLLQKLR